MFALNIQGLPSGWKKALCKCCEFIYALGSLNAATFLAHGLLYRAINGVENRTVKIEKAVNYRSDKITEKLPRDLSFRFTFRSTMKLYRSHNISLFLRHLGHKNATWQINDILTVKRSIKAKNSRDMFEASSLPALMGVPLARMRQ